jgi:hypothetical protein
LLIMTTAVVVAATMVLAGTAFAQSENANPSCFGVYAQNNTAGGEQPGPGFFVKTVTTAPGPVDELAGFVGDINQRRPCPTTRADFEGLFPPTP